MDEEALTTFLSLLETAMQLDAFTQQQKFKMSSWGHHISQMKQAQQQQQRQQQQFGFLLVPPARLPVIHPLLQHTHTQSFLAKRPSLQNSPSEVSPNHFWARFDDFGSSDEPGHSYVQRTYSAPPNPPPDHLSDTDPDLNSRLESLCLSMTEHSLEL